MSDYLTDSDRDLREQIAEQWEVLRDKGGEAPEVFQPGDRVIWMYEARGGYGYTFRMPATVVRVQGERATIQVDQPEKSRRDYSRKRSVLLSNLRPMEQSHA